MGRRDRAPRARRACGAVFAAGALFFVIASPLNAAPAIQHWVTANGARVYFVPAPELPMADIDLVFDAGSARDGERWGMAHLTNALLNGGAGDYDADQLAERFERVGAEFGTDVDRDLATVSLRCLTDPEVLEPVIDTLALVLSDPTFPPEALERERRRQQAAVRAEQQSPGEIASKAFYETVYAGHPYGSPPLGNMATLAALTRAELRDFHRRYYVARNAVLTLVGALTRAEAERIAERLTAALPEGAPAAALPPVPEARAALRHLEYPSTQTHVLAGQPGMARGDPDYFALYVGNHVLGGGGLVSRINEEIREKRGLSYSAYSYFMPLREPGPFIMGLQTRNDQAAEAERVLAETLRGFVATGPSTAEVDSAKRNISGGFPLRIDSNRKIADYLAVIGFYALPLDYLDTFTARIDAIGAAEIRDAFRRRVHPDALVTVTVGAAPPP